MGYKKIAVYGIYPNRADVEKAVDQLKMSGFSNSDISVLFGPEFFSEFDLKLVA